MSPVQVVVLVGLLAMFFWAFVALDLGWRGLLAATFGAVCGLLFGLAALLLATMVV